MPRPPRRDYEGAWHHVMNRGAGRRRIFASDQERERFIGCLAEGCRRHAVEVHGYCLLGNHYHLLLRSRDGKLSAAMQWLSSRYTQSLNYDTRSDGSLFRGRFASVLIEDDDHLREASRYIHLNPVAAGLVERPELWPWSSAAAYLGLARRKDWLEIETVRGMFGPEEETRCYAEFVNDGADRQARLRYEKLMWEHGVRPAGSDPC